KPRRRFLTRADSGPPSARRQEKNVVLSCHRENVTPSWFALAGCVALPLAPLARVRSLARSTRGCFGSCWSASSAVGLGGRPGPSPVAVFFVSDDSLVEVPTDRSPWEAAGPSWGGRGGASADPWRGSAWCDSVAKKSRRQRNGTPAEGDSRRPVVL